MRVGLLCLIFLKQLTGLGILHKFQDYGISGEILGIIKSFLADRSLQVTLDGVSSSSFSINAGVPQGSILGATLFLLYNNDLPENILQNIDIFAILTIYSSYLIRKICELLV